MPGTAETTIYNRLAAAPTFHPASVSLFLNDWAIEPGDVVTVKSGTDSYSVPVYYLNLEWKGKSRAIIQSTGNEKREPLPALKRRQFGSGAGAYEQEKRFRAMLTQMENDLGAQIGLVVEEVDGVNVIKTASIVAAINEAGSSILLNADKIAINNTTLDTQFTLESGRIDLLVTKTGIDSLGNDETLYSRIEQTADSISTIVTKTGVNSLGENETLYSRIEQTASSITSIATDVNSLSSRIEQTASSITSIVTDVNSLSSRIEQTAGSISSIVTDMNSLSSRIEQTADSISSVVTNVNSLSSRIEQTAGSISSIVADVNSLSSRIEQTAGSITSIVTNVNSLSSRIEQTAGSISSIVTDVNSLSSRIEQTAGSISSIVTDINGLSSRIEQTAGSISSVVTDVNSLSSRIEQTAGSISSIVTSVNSLSSRIEQTAGSISAVVSDVNSIKSSGLWINRDNIALLNGAITFKDDYIQDSSGTYYYNTTTQQYEIAPSGYTGVKYRKEQNLHVEDGVGLKIDKTVGSSVASFGVYDTNNLTAGYIISMINGQSTATISADKINLEGYVTADNLASKISEIQTLTGMAASFSGNVSASGVLAYDVQIGGMGNYQSLSTAVKTIVQNTSPPSGQIGIIYTKFDGTTQTVNFNIADTQYYQDGVSAAWTEAKNGTSLTRSGATLTYVHPAATKGTFTTETKTIEAQVGARYNSSTHKYAIAAAAKIDNETADTDSSTTGTEAYDAGVTDGAAGVTVSGASGWASGSNVLTLSNGNTYTTYMPSDAIFDVYKDGRTYSIYCTVGGKEYSYVYTS